MLVGPALSTEPYLDTSREVGSWWFECCTLMEQSGLFSGVLPAEFEVTIPDGSVSTGASFTGGTGVGEVSFPTLATGLSILLCSGLGLIGSSYVGSGCTLPCP